MFDFWDIFISFLLGAVIGALIWRHWRKQKLKVLTKDRRVYLKLRGAEDEVERFFQKVQNWPGRTSENTQIEARKLDGWLSERLRKIQHELYKQDELLKSKNIDIHRPSDESL